MSLLKTLLKNKTKAKYRKKNKKVKYLLKQYKIHLESMPETLDTDDEFNDKLFKEQKHWATMRTVFRRKLLELDVTYDELDEIDTRVFKQDTPEV